MNKTAYNILRVGLGITFLWIGIIILKEPEAWGSYIQNWVVELLPLPIKDIMISTAILDIIIGFLLLIDTWVWIAAIVGALHLVVVLVVSGITEITVRDLGIMAGMFALFAQTLPQSIIQKFKRKPTPLAP
ncbi:hypothetical protein A2733_01365 [Candidatus Nomurabacteria bacterium RIFCSPHIGHO2_01_FULL_40_20]|uniref:DoxX family protein n=1 Tax=Candidatus Nomurabacteria bacterium RIFCSPHIGHO2_01_FULL_40_20 TaxID=1801738 RepID=A0A1F6V440_9BACT|nr:MAG: hypothetical protein A2733_01365 [Candidatus Nomurabacteria bacterium RIFCSPHIGHO2_01_FULL_40_20]